MLPEHDVLSTERARLRAAARPLGARGMIHVVAQACGLPPPTIRGYCRTKQACLARHVLYYVLREICGWPTDYIAEVLHRDQATIRHGLKRARELLQAPEGRATLQAVAELLLKGPPHR